MIITKWNIVKRAVIPALIVFLLCIVFFAEVHRIPIYRYNDGNAGNTVPIGTITENTQVVQELPYTRDLRGYSILFATYARVNSGNVAIRVVGQTSGNVYASQTLPASGFADNSYVDVLFSNFPVSDLDQVLVLTVSADSQPSEALTIWATNEDSIPGCSLTVGGDLREGDICVRGINCDSDLRNYAIIVFSFLLILVTGSMFLLGRGQKIEMVYTVLASSLGIVYLFTMTPLSIPDEPHHYHSAYQLSNILNQDWDKIGYGDSADFNYSRLTGHYNVASAYERLMEELSVPGVEGELVEIPQPRSLKYPIEYLPQAIGISIARLLGANFLITFYLGRLFNLVFFVACLFFTIRLVPRFKLLFVVLGVAPMVLHQAASFSCDGFINGVSFLLIALILRSIYAEGAFSKKEFWPIVITSMLLAPAKLVYYPILLLVLLIPKERFQGAKQKARTVALLLFVAIVPLCLFGMKSMFSMAVSTERALNWEGGHNYTTAFILHHPGKTVAIFARTFSGSGVRWFKEAIGATLCGLSLGLPDWTTWCFIIILAISALGYAGDIEGLKTKERVAFLAVSVIVTLLIMLSMFLGWTSDTRSVILGVQGRYFIPILPLLLLQVNNQRIQLQHSVERPVLLSALLMDVAVINHVIRTTIGF